MSNAFRPLPFVLRQTFCLTLFSSLFLIQSFQHPLCIVVPTKPICLIWFVKPFDLPCNIVLFFSIFFFLFLQFSRRLFVRFATFFACARRVFNSGVLLVIFSCPRSLFLPQWYLPVRVAFSTRLFACICRIFRSGVFPVFLCDAHGGFLYVCFDSILFSATVFCYF